MDNNISLKDILETYEQITVKNVISDSIVMFLLFGKTFLFFAPIVNEPSSRPSIYLYNDDGCDFPHIMLRDERIEDSKSFPPGNYRFVCLYEHESIVYSLVSYEDKIYDAVDRLIELLSMTQVEIEREFQKEFMFYWNNAANGNIVNVFLTKESIFLRMNVYAGKKGTRLIESGLQLNDIDLREKNDRVWTHHIENDVFYIPITDTRGILPPHRGHAWSVEDVKNIIYGNQVEHISSDTFQQLQKEVVSTQNCMLVFGLNGHQAKATFAVKIKCKNGSKRTVFQKIVEDAIAIELIPTSRKDYSFLSNQIGNDIGLYGKKVLLIGAGSLGSYVALELVKNGVRSLKIYDGDILSEENILRWAFAAFGIGMNKSKLLEIQLGMLHPEIYVEGISSNIGSNTLSKEAKEADLIVFTIGSSDQQLLFNRTLHNEKCNVPVLYAWLEAGGKYSHILAVDYGKRGCYECLFTDNEGQLVNNRALLNTNDIQDNLIIRNGCGGTRAAYGTTVLLRTTAALLDTIHKVLDGSITENTLINITPNNIHVSSGLIPMERCSCCGN